MKAGTPGRLPRKHDIGQAGLLEEGATVKASYEEKDGKKVVSKIDITPGQ